MSQKRDRVRSCLALLIFVCAITAHAQGGAPSVRPAPPVVQAVGVSDQLAALGTLAKGGKADAQEALVLREQVMERVMLASFDVDEMLGKIDAEAAHVSDSRSVLETQKEHRDAELNIATFAIGGALGTAGSAMQLTGALDHAGNALNVAAGATALSLSIAQLRNHGERRVLLSPFNMLAEVLGQTPNAQSHYPPVVEAYLHSPSAGDGELPDGVPPEESLRNTWYRLHRLQHGDDKHGANLASVTTDPTDGRKLTAAELTDREAMLRDLHGTVALLKVELRGILLQMSAERQPQSQ